MLEFAGLAHFRLEPNPAFELTMAERFQQESMVRALQECRDPDALRNHAIDLLRAWVTARAALRGTMFQNLPEPWQKVAESRDLG